MHHVSASLAVRHAPRTALIVGALVVSHWVLDVIVHAPDLPLYPGGPRFGLGAWNSIPLTMILEGVAYFGGLAVYLRTTSAVDRMGSYGLWALVLVQAGIFVAASGGPPPSSVSMLGGSALLLWIFIPWAAWVDRRRRTTSAPVSGRTTPIRP